MNISTSINVCFDREFYIPVEEQIQRVYDAGFRHMDMNFWDWAHPDTASPFIGRDWEKWVERIANKAEKLGVKFTQSHAHVAPLLREQDSQRLAHGREMYRRSLIGSAMLNISFCTFHPVTCEGWEELSEKEKIARNVELFAPYVELGEKVGVGLALENMSKGRSGFTTAAQLNRLADAFSSRYVGLCWDTGHGHLAGQDQIDSLKTMGKRLKNLHIADNFGINDDHMPPFFGSICWEGFGDALREIGFEGDFTFEAHNIVRRVPMGCRAEALRLLLKIGEEVVRGGMPV